MFASCVRNWPTFEVFLAETARHGLVWRDVDFAPAARDEDIVFVLEEALGFSNEKIRIASTFHGLSAIAAQATNEEDEG